jgi:hypothetical protein
MVPLCCLYIYGGDTYALRNYINELTKKWVTSGLLQNFVRKDIPLIFLE